MKNIFTLLFLCLSYGLTAQTGCLEAVNGQQPYGQGTVYCNNQFQNITTVASAGTFSLMEISADRTYTFKSSIATDLLTLSNEEGSQIIGVGTGTAVITPTADQVIRIYIHSDDQCGSSTTFRIKSVKCDPGPDPNNPTEPVEGCLTSAYSNTVQYTPFCNGFDEIITEFAFTGSYSPVFVTANTTYTFKSSDQTNHITITNALGSAIIALGVGEVRWTAVADGEVQFQIFTDENCGIGDATEEGKTVTVRCGEQAPPSEGCLNAPNGQAPVAVFVPICNTTVETVVPMGSTGEYAMVQVTANMAYTFYSSVPSDMITVGNEEGTEVLGYGFGQYEWTADSDRLVRFYTHVNASCAIDVSTRIKAIKCGLPFVATEPDFACFDGDGLFSNNYEEGYSISEQIPSVADDFIVEDQFSMQQVRLNLFAMDEIQNISFKFYADNNNTPGEVTHTALNIVPTEQLVIGAKNGFLVYQVTVNLPNALNFTAGKYWMQPEANSIFGAIWEMTSTGSNESKVQVLTTENVWQPTNYQAVFFVAGECTILNTEAFLKNSISFSPNPVKDVITFSSESAIENVSVYNISGQLLKDVKPEGGKVNITDLQAGLYLFKARLETGEIQALKVIKE
jgi:hypothetical protein